MPRMQLCESSPQHSGAATVSLVALMGALFAAPLAFGSVEPWAWAGLSALVAVAFFCWAMNALERQSAQFVWTPLYIPLVLLLLFALLQIGLNRTAYFAGTRNAALALATDLLVFFLSVNLLSTASRRVWSWMGWSISLYALALSMFAILQFFSSPDRIYWTFTPAPGGGVFGPYVDPDHYAGLMELLIPLLAGFALSRSPNRGQPLLAFAILVSIASLTLSGSRSAVVALLVEAAAFVIIAGLFDRFRRQSVWITSLAGIATIVISLWLIPANILHRFQDAMEHPAVTYAKRSSITLDTLRITRDNIAFGSGMGTLKSIYLNYQSFPTDLIIDHAHNDYAEALAETGVIGGLILVAALSLFFREFRSTRRRLRSTFGWLQVGAALGCCGLLIHSATDFNLHIPANAAWFALAAGCACSQPSDNEENVSVQ